MASPPGWVLVLPLKGGSAAKSRLGGGPDLARAIAQDCLDAVLTCPVVARTVVVTADGPTAAMARVAGAEVVTESRPGGGLVAAVRDGLHRLAPAPGTADDPTPRPVGVLLGDLPALRPGDLAEALETMAATLRARPDAPMAVVPDAAGTGSVLLAARTAADLDPAFGPESLAEHRRRGAVRVDLDAPRLRQDVDTAADLVVALSLGVGPHTVRAVAATRHDGRPRTIGRSAAAATPARLS